MERTGGFSYLRETQPLIELYDAFGGWVTHPVLMTTASWEAPGQTVPTAPVVPTGDPSIDGLLGETRWNGPIGYSDPLDPADYGPDYPDPLDGFARLSADQLAAAHAALIGGLGFGVADFTRLDVTYQGPGGAGTIRLGNIGDNPTAYAFYPSDLPDGGDVFFGDAGDNPVLGNYDALTVLHELGHTLGLKHGHEATFFGALPAATDSLEYTVMTYRSFIGAEPGVLHNEHGGYPQSYMTADIAALQHLYGANFDSNAGDTTYRWSPDSGRTWVNDAVAIDPGSNRIFLTVWDGGGTDTYDMSAYTTGLRVDLAPGHASTFDSGQLARLGGGPNGGYARGNVANALLHEGDRRSLIENATGGSGDDRIAGNSAGNALAGNAGADTLMGRQGDDRLAGGADRDVLRGGRDDDLLVGGADADVLKGGYGRDIFRFDAAEDSGPGAADILRETRAAPAFQRPGARRGDVIDLSAIDARPDEAGNQDFKLGSGHGVGHLWATDVGRDTVLHGNCGGGQAARFELVIEDGPALASAYTPDDFFGVT